MVVYQAEMNGARVGEWGGGHKTSVLHSPQLTPNCMRDGESDKTRGEQGPFFVPHRPPLLPAYIPPTALFVDRM